MKLNKVLVTGRCGQDIEIKKINDSFSVGQVNICSDESYKDKNGEWVNPANWLTVKIKNEKILKFVSDIAKKGVEICVEGSIKTETWDSDSGKKSRTLIEIGPFNGSIQRVSREAVAASAPITTEPIPTTPTTPESGGGEQDLPF